MARVSFQVVDGVDKGRGFVELETPVTIGREEGNVVRLNDERVSRFHAKVQEDHGQVVLTDLDSTNGTSVNGEPIQLRLLRPGDRVSLGRSTLIFGSPEEIAALARKEEATRSGQYQSAPTVHAKSFEDIPEGLGTDLSFSVTSMTPDPNFDVFEREQPELPTRLSPAQAAQLSEVLDFLHRALASATDAVHIPANGVEARLPLANWLRLQTVLTFLARYSRKIAEPQDTVEKAH